MITEDYVSFETAKLLKEKGFDEKCNASYRDYTSSYDMNHWITIAFDEKETDDMKFICYAPTLYKTMKWLREVHNLFIAIMAGDDDGKIWYDFDVINIGKKNTPIVPIGDVVKLKTYEQACEAAIKYCLKNLI